MILGHFALAGIAKQTCFQKENLFFLAIASVMPDLLDKPANFIFGLPGRGIGHSVLILVAVAVTLWIVCSRLKFYSGFVFAGTVMWVSHLAGDFLSEKILFWPFLGELESAPYVGFVEKLDNFYVARAQPEQLLLEIICIVALLSLWILKSFKPKPVYARFERQEVQRNRRL